MWNETRREVFLQPGDHCFGAAPDRMRTLLGSCVAITLWHPRLRQGGMVHCLLPSRSAPAETLKLSGRFVDEGVRWLLREAAHAMVDPAQCEFKLFGGSNMFAAFGIRAEHRATIGESNARTALRMLERLGFDVRVTDVGGTVHRALAFDLSTGEVWVRYGEPLRPDETRESACA